LVRNSLRDFDMAPLLRILDDLGGRHATDAGAPYPDFL
jgi:hypothetical protein